MRTPDEIAAEVRRLFALKEQIDRLEWHPGLAVAGAIASSIATLNWVAGNPLVTSPVVALAGSPDEEWAQKKRAAGKLPRRTAVSP